MVRCYWIANKALNKDFIIIYIFIHKKVAEKELKLFILLHVPIFDTVYVSVVSFVQIVFRYTVYRVVQSCCLCRSFESKCRSIISIEIMCFSVI